MQNVVIHVPLLTIDMYHVHRDVVLMFDAVSEADLEAPHTKYGKVIGGM